MRPSGNVLPAYWCVWLHVVWLCCGKESNGKISKASFLVLELERIISKYSSVNPNIFFYHLQTILFMGTKPTRRCEKRHKKPIEFLCKKIFFEPWFWEGFISRMYQIFVCRVRVSEGGSKIFGNGEKSGIYLLRQFQLPDCQWRHNRMLDRVNRLGITTDIKKLTGCYRLISV